MYFVNQAGLILEQTELLVKSANEYGMKSRLHVDEFVDSGGLSLAAELKSCSADHVGYSNLDSRDKAHNSGTMQVFSQELHMC